MPQTSKHMYQGDNKENQIFMPKSKSPMYKSPINAASKKKGLLVSLIEVDLSNKKNAKHKYQKSKGAKARSFILLQKDGKARKASKSPIYDMDKQQDCKPFQTLISNQTEKSMKSLKRKLKKRTKKKSKLRSIS